MKKILLAGLLGLASFLGAAQTVTVAATPVPHAQILEQIKDDLKSQGYELVIKEFTDYILPNMATQSGEVDANFFQHVPYLTEFNKSKKTTLVSVGGVHIEPMAVYSKKLKKLGELKSGARVAVPNDPTNESRALDLIAKAGLIEFKDAKKELKTPVDISKNPKNLKFVELKAAQLPRALDDTDLAVINSNYALEAKLNPLKDGLLIEDKDSPYVNILVTKAGREKEPKIQALLKALQSDKVRKFILEKYQGSVVPAF